LVERHFAEHEPHHDLRVSQTQSTDRQVTTSSLELLNNLY